MKADSGLRVLIVEDSEDDARLLLRELRHSGYLPESARVDSAAAMRAALAARSWDVIVSDYMLPGFGGLEALRIAKESGLDLPFIIVSSKASEETLVEAMRAGATDFVMKDRLERLGPVVKRELADAAARRGLRQAQIEWRTAFDAVRDAIFIHDAEFRILRANLAYAELAGLRFKQIIGKRYWEVFPRRDGPLPGCSSVMAGSGTAEDRIDAPNGTVFASRSFAVRDATGKHVFSVHVMQDVTERDRVQEAVAKSERQFRALLEHASDLVTVVDVSGTITYISPSIGHVGGYATDEVMGRNFMEFIHPADAAAAAAAYAETIRKPGVLHATEYRFRHKGGEWKVLETVARNALADPLISGIVMNSRDVTEGKRATRKLRAAFESLIAVLAATVERRDPYTAGHQRRVAELAAAIARTLGFEPARIEGLHFAATIHDIGKIYVPAEILSRPGKLPLAEFELVKSHAQVGFEIVKDVEFPWQVADMIRQHHERLDGSGYPQGLAGDQILPESRILAVADVVEAMSSHRPYRPGLGLDAALAQIRQDAGTKLDAQVVDACERVFREQGFSFAKT